MFSKKMAAHRPESLLAIFVSLLSISNGLSPDIARQLQEELDADGIFSGKIHYRWDSNYCICRKTFDI